MHVILTVVGGKADRRQVRVRIPVLIGRSREAGLVVAHPMVSRRHCELYYDRGVLRVRDLGSLNGVYVGGRRVVDAPLPPQAEFTVGPLTLRVDYSPEVLAQQFARLQAAANGPESQASPPPLPGSENLQADVGEEFELEPDVSEVQSPADRPGIFPAFSLDSSVSEGSQSHLESGNGIPHKGKHSSQLDEMHTLFPEDLPPELGR